MSEADRQIDPGAPLKPEVLAALEEVRRRTVPAAGHAVVVALAAGGVGAVVFDSLTAVTGRAVLTGLTSACAAAGRDSALYELHSAVLRALDVPDANDRWVAGDDVFAGCKRLPPKREAGSGKREADGR